MSVNVTFSRMVTSGFGLCVVVAVVVVVVPLGKVYCNIKKTIIFYFFKFS